MSSLPRCESLLSAEGTSASAPPSTPLVWPPEWATVAGRKLQGSFRVRCVVAVRRGGGRDLQPSARARHRCKVVSLGRPALSLADEAVPEANGIRLWP